MSAIDTRFHQRFPKLDPVQVEVMKRFASGGEREFQPGETVFEVGQRNSPAWLILRGSIDVVRRDGLGHEQPIVSHMAGQFSGEISQLAGRASLAAGKAGAEGCVAVPLDAPHLRALVIGSAEIGEIVMRAYILRRVALIEGGNAGSTLLGRANDRDLVRLQGFLTRNGHPNTVLDCHDAEARALIERLGIAEEDLPILICPNGTVLKHPTNAEAGVCLGMTPELDPSVTYDVAIVGAGPAGLATAVYAASEGLKVLVLDTRAIGGQAGASARIENYLGFPTGISGQALAGRAFTQAQKFGAELAIPLEVTKLTCPGTEDDVHATLDLLLSDGKTISSRTVVIASGASYRRPDIANLATFEGRGISYWASPVEAQLCKGEEVALVGGGNSAGQAVVYLAPKVKHLHLVIRANGLESSMSQYLIERIAALPNVEIHTNTEVTELGGDETRGLQEIVLRKAATGTTLTRNIKHLFLFVGADPNTGWLNGCVDVDNKGFVLTGADRNDSNGTSLETNRSGVFAIGDVRASSTKRVAAAVGDGAAVVAQIHGYLARRERQRAA
ncbi:FAD-dependent oxidoreductase [Flaviflagellibacter deserti]|uniref:Thioredoxin reductase n=1 Tax=Flaviflagellibacter deserti TaxID=2267266 RepID=A0ABV9Z4P6_9HYPH